jgi:hypothetical protein
MDLANPGDPGLLFDFGELIFAHSARETKRRIQIQPLLFGVWRACAGL